MNRTRRRDSFGSCRPAQDGRRRRLRLRPWLSALLSACMLMWAGLAPTPADADPPSTQEAVLEAVGQDMVRQRLNELTLSITGLLRDLESNGLLDEGDQTQLEMVIADIREIREVHVNRAAQALRQAATGRDEQKHLALAEAHIDMAARKIGRIIMLRLGVKYATEVFGIELREVARRQEEVYLGTMDADEGMAGADARELAEAQTAVADRLNELIARLARESDYKESDYKEDALLAVRLARVVSQLREATVEASLHSAASDLDKGAWERALPKQHSALMSIMKAEFRLRPGAELHALVRSRDALQVLRGDQRALREQVSRWDVSALRERRADARGRQVRLRRRLERVIIPPILEEQLELAADVFAATGLQTAMSDPVPVEDLVAEAVGQMDVASDALDAASPAAAGKAQVAAEDALHEAIVGLQKRIEAAMHLDLVFRRLQEARRRLKYISSLEDRQKALREETEQAKVDQGESRHLAMPQDHLAVEADAFSTRTARDNDELDEPSEFVPTICRQIDLASGFMRKAQGPLTEDTPAAAIPQQDQSLHWLGKARETAEQEVATLERLYQLLQAVKDLERFAGYLADLEAQQRELRGRTKDAGPESAAVKVLASPQGTLALAVGEVGDILADPRLGRLGQLLESAQASMSAAKEQLASGAGGAAMPHQERAEKTLQDAQAEVKRLAEEFDFLAAWIEFLKQLNADALDLLQRQIELRIETQDADIAAFGELSGEQDILRAEAVTFSELFPIGQKDYATAAEEMLLAMQGLDAKDRVEALRHMALAEEALTRALEQLLAAMEALDRVPMLMLMSEPSEELLLITRILVLSAQQRSLRRKTRAVETDEGVQRFADPQGLLRQEARDIAALAEEEWPLLSRAESEMSSAIESLHGRERSPAIRHQQLAEKHLRQLLLELALAEFEVPEELIETMSMAVPQIMPSLIIMESEHAFAREAVEGEFSSGSRTEWRVLGRRDRAALNQNFARELPLEYRDMLRAYFERLSE